MSSSNSLSRRDFLRRSAGVVAAAPLFIPGTALGKGDRPAPSERITVGLIGAGKRGGTLLGRAGRFADFQFVAAAEVEGSRRAHRAKWMEDHHAKDRASGTFSGVKTYVDFRELLDRDDVDAVIVATPDHWHAIPVIEAAKRKKDVYCEKPLSLTIEEARLMWKASEKHGIVLQTGSQQRSECGGRFHKACSLVRAGRIGTVKEVWVNVGGPSRPCDLPEQPVPPDTDWNLWLGPAPWRGYHEALCPKGVHGHYPAFRDYREYSGGGMTDWGAHHFDIAQWGLGRDESGPVEIHPPNGKDRSHLTYVYDDGVVMYRASKYGGENIDGLRFVGADGMIEVNRGTFRTWPESIGKEALGDDDPRLYKASDHMGDWLECVRSRKHPICRGKSVHAP